MGHVMIMRKGDVHTAPIDLSESLIGTVWRLTMNGWFDVPADGKYLIEMHGGGGGAAHLYTYDDINSTHYRKYTGGGSGEVWTVSLKKGDTHQVTIGAGGAKGASSGDAAGTGGTTTFGSLLSLAGGGGGRNGYPGAASGSLATAGRAVINDSATYPGGYGNKNVPSQTYGNGGGCFGAAGTNNGSAGAVIITYLGKE
jgi:hypothetical protein